MAHASPLALDAATVAVAGQAEASFLALTQATDQVQFKLADNAITDFLKLKVAPAILFHLLRHSQQETVRQQAAVHLRKKIVAFWGKGRIGNARQTEIQAAIISLLTSEPSRLVRKGLIAIAAALGKELLPNDAWPELSQLLSAAVSSPSPQVRELGMLLLSDLSISMEQNIAGLAPAMKQPLMNGLVDVDASVRTASLTTLHAMLTHVNEEQVHELYADIFGPLMAATQGFLGFMPNIAADEESAVSVLALVDDLLEAGSAIVEGHEMTVIRSMLAVIRTASLSTTLRVEAADVLLTAVRLHAKTVKSTSGGIEDILQALFTVVERYDPEAEKEREDAARAAGLGVIQLIDSDDLAANIETAVQCLAKVLPERAFFRAFMTIAGPLLNSSLPAQRRAALRLIGQIAEGCPSILSEHLGDVLNAITPACHDACAPVRVALAFCLANMCSHVARMSDFHAEVLPAVLQLLADASPSAAMWGANVIDAICEELSREAIKPYTAAILDKLAALMASSDLGCQEAVLPALASVALAASEGFTPYLAGIASAVLSIMQRTEPELLVMRCRATECMGHISKAVGSAAFEPYVQPAMTIALAGYGQNIPELQRACLFFLASAAATLGTHPAFLSILPQLLPICISIVTSNASVVPVNAGGPGVAEGAPGPAEQAGDGDEEEDEDYDPDGEDSDEINDTEDSDAMEQMQQATALDRDLRQVAIVAMSHVMTYCVTPTYVEHIAPMITAIFNAMKHFDDEIREEAVKATFSILQLLLHSHSPPRVGSVYAHPYPSSLANQWSPVLKRMIKIVRTDSSKTVVSTACDAISRIMKVGGPGAILPGMRDRLIRGLVCILKEKAACQSGEEDEVAGFSGGKEEEDDSTVGEEEEEEDAGTGVGDADDDDDARLSDNLIDDASDALCDLMAALGQDFVPYLPTVMEAYAKFMRPARLAKERLVAIGACSEMLKGLPEVAMAPYADGMLAAMLEGARSTYTDLQRNSAFGLGTLAERMPSRMRPHVEAMLSALQPMFLLKRGVASHDAAIDNAAAAVCRILIAMPDVAAISGLGALPAVVSALPLQLDREEDDIVYRTVLGAAVSGHPEAISGPVLTGILSACAAALVQGSLVLPEVVERTVRPGLQALKAVMGGAQAGLSPLLQASVDGVIEPGRSALLAVLGTN